MSFWNVKNVKKPKPKPVVPKPENPFSAPDLGKRLKERKQKASETNWRYV